MFNRSTKFGILFISAMLAFSACGKNLTPGTIPTQQDGIASPSFPPLLLVEPSVVPSIDPITRSSVSSLPLSESPLFIETEYQLVPKEQEDQDFGIGFSMNYFYHDFDSIYEDFTDAIHSKDLSVLDGFLDENITVSFGADVGKDYFYEYWGLNENPEQSELWEILDKIIALGGVFSYDIYDVSEDPYMEAENRRFVAPYIFANFKLDEFEHFVIIDKDVKVYEQENSDSNVIGNINYSILKQNFNNVSKEIVSEFWEKTDLDFVKIQTLSGVEGYIQKQYLRSPIDYRFRFISHDGGDWKMDYLVAGD